MKFYIAAAWPAKDKARRIRDHLLARGHEVTATWMDHGRETYGIGDLARQEAIRDLEELRAAEAFVIYSGIENSRGGRDFELGFAYADRYPIIFIGQEDCVFHHLPDVQMRRFSSIREFEEAFSEI